MKRRELVLAVAGLLLVLVASGLCLPADGRPWGEGLILTDQCVVPASIYDYAGYNGDKNAVVIFHGLSANRKLMLTLARWLRADDTRVFLVDFPGHGDSTESFTFEKAERCAASLLDALERKGEIRPERTVLVGHSMGAAIAIRMADLLPVAGTIAISPAPLVSDGAPAERVFFRPPHRMPVNLLLLTGQFEPQFTESGARELLKRAGGERISSEDFAQRRAAAFRLIPGATHTSLIMDPQVALEVNRWIASAIGRSRASLTPRFSLAVIYGAGLGLLGLAMIFPGMASLLTRNQKTENHSPPSPPATRMLVGWVVAAVAAAFIQFKFVPLGPVVRMYSGDYLASALMIVGVVLLAWQVRARNAVPLHWDGRAVASAAVLGMATMLAFGAWLNWQIADTWLNAPRWWRFALLVPLMLPYFVAEEIALGAPEVNFGHVTGVWSRLWARCRAETRRYTFFLTLRAILWLAMAFGLFALGSAQVLMVLLVIYMVAFSIAQRAGMDAVRRRTGSAAAAAVFGAILAAWFIAAVFPIT